MVYVHVVLVIERL